MSFAISQGSPPTPIAASGAEVPPAPPRSQPKKSVEAAWAVWRADLDGSSGAEFLRSVASWTEGTAAQLLRQPWSRDTKRPTAPEVQERLRRLLGIAVDGDHANYRDALAWARGEMIEELRQARSPEGGPTS